MPHLNCHEGVTLPVCESTHVSVHRYRTLFLLLQTLLVSLLSVFLGILLCKAQGPGPCP